MSGRRDESIILESLVDAAERLTEISKLGRAEFDAAEAERGPCFLSAPRPSITVR